jgi:hypothetical protein
MGRKTSVRTFSNQLSNKNLPRKGGSKAKKKMKKILVILVAVVGFGISVNAQNCSGICSWCRSTLEAKKVSCPNARCNKGIVSDIGKVDCTHCERTGKQKCTSKDGRNLSGRWTHCANCSYCQGTGKMSGTVKVGCTCCGGTPDRAGAGWVYGCKCPKCNKEYADCN